MLLNILTSTEKVRPMRVPGWHDQFDSFGIKGVCKVPHDWGVDS